MKMLFNKRVAKATQVITAIKLIAVFFLCGVSFGALAQATVRDSSPITPVPVSPTERDGSVTASQPQSVDYQVMYQLQQLQQEVSELRGMLEEQGFELKRLKQQRLDDYLDLDKRIGELSQQQSSSSTTGSSEGTSSLSTLSNTSVPGTTETTVVDNSAAEKQLYRDAIDQLLNKQDYKGAQTSFSQYLTEYPSGVYVPNVHYWQGQIYLTDSNKKAAEKSFSTLVEQYPDHQKASDAKYKLATIYFDQGKKAEAKKLLDEVAASNSDASRLAKAFLSKQY